MGRCDVVLNLDSEMQKSESDHNLKSAGRRRDDYMGKDPNGSVESVRLFTDGACSGNPGPGGWAFILTHPATGRSRDASGAEWETTNNRMELTGVIKGLSSLKRPCEVELVTDSQYVAKGISEWLPNWKRQGWQRKENGQSKPVKNVDLWQEVDLLLSTHKVRVTHVPGHRGHPENEACDRMAVDAYKRLMAEQKDRR
jgi:ribonuclease HI